MQHTFQMRAALKTFNPEQMNEGEMAINCPLAKPAKRKNNAVVVVMKMGE